MKNKKKKFLILILLFPLCLFAERENKISLTIEIDKSKPVKSIPVKFLIKNISKENLLTRKLELSHLGIASKDNEGIGFPYMQASFHSHKEGKIIKPGDTFIVIRELKDYFSSDDKWNEIKNSKKDFNIFCTVRYLGNSYSCNDLKLKIN